MIGDLNSILGSYNSVLGSQNMVKGQSNIINGKENLINGGENKLKGDNNKISGGNNVVVGSNNSVITDLEGYNFYWWLCSIFYHTLISLFKTIIKQQKFKEMREIQSGKQLGRSYCVTVDPVLILFHLTQQRNQIF